MHKKQFILLMIPSVILGVFAVLMVHAYIIEQREVAIEDAKVHARKVTQNQAQILIARKNIPKGSKIDPKTLSTEFIPRESLAPRAVSYIPQGMSAMADILKGEQLTLDKIGDPKKTAEQRYLSGAIPVGKRAITIKIDNMAALEGMLKPSDYVDVLATIALPSQATPGGEVTYQPAVIPLLQNVLILAVGQDIERVARIGAVEPLITLALTPQEATVIAFVQEQGKISLVLRSPREVDNAAKAEMVTTSNVASFLQGVLPQQQAQPEPAVEPGEEEFKVEIYRGANKENKKLSK